MKTSRVLVSLTMVATVLVAGRLVHGAQEAEGAAVASADAWLAKVDQGRYGDSWDEAAELFKAAVTKEQWEAAVVGARKPFGDLLSRKVKSTQYAESLPGAPDGKYVVIQYESSFANKKSAIETVTPMMDLDGRWRVSGYFIK